MRCEERAWAIGPNRWRQLFLRWAFTRVGGPNIAMPHPKAARQRLAPCPAGGKTSHHANHSGGGDRNTPVTVEKYRAAMCGPNVVWPAICEKHPTGGQQGVVRLWAENYPADVRREERPNSEPTPAIGGSLLGWAHAVLALLCCRPTCHASRFNSRLRARNSHTLKRRCAFVSAMLRAA